MRQPSIKDQLIAAIDELLQCTKLQSDELELETRDAITNAHHVLNKAFEATKPKM